MAEVDTSSYPKATAPVSLLDNVQKLGALQQQQQSIQSGALTIDKQKLDLVNQRFGEMAKGFTQLINDKDLNEDKVRSYVTNQVKLGYVPPEMAAQTISMLPPTQGLPPQQATQVLKTALEQHLQHAQSTVDAINYHAGTNAEQQDNSNIYSGVRQSASKGGGFTPATQTPIQLPPNQPNMDTNPQSPNYLRPGVIGPSAPAGPKPYVAAPAPAAGPPPDPNSPVNDPSQGNLTGPPATGLKGAVQPPDFKSRFGAAFPNSVATGPAPGQQSAMEAVGSQSGKDYASALTRGKNFQSDLYPMQKVLDIVKEQGPTAFGPGTDNFNNLKAAVVTWLPNIDQKTIDSVTDFTNAKKLLVQAARTAGNTGTNDQLAAAFDANPNVTMSGATIDTVLKSNIALRKMEQAQTLLFGKTGLPDNQYSKWIATNQNVLDARAFGFDMMDTKAQTKLVAQLKKDPKAFKKFESSLQFAHDAELIEPPASK